MNYERIVLDNGLRLILAPMQEVNSFTITVFVRAGSRYETAENSGISHFLEHMLFKGTSRRPTSLEISEEIDTIGGEFNAGTSKEYTVYYIKAAAEHLDLCIDVLADMLVHSKLDWEEIESEKGVILEELKMYEDMPMRDIEDVYEQLIFGDQPLGWKTIGNRESVSATTQAGMRDYLASLYTNDNILIGIAGKFDPAHAKARVSESFSGLAAGPADAYVAHNFHQDTPALLFRTKETEQAHLVLGVRAFKRGDADEYAAKVLNVILGANMSSRLFIEVRERQKLCYYIRSGTTFYHDAGSLEVQAGVDLTRIEQATESILRELSGFSERLVADKELNKAKQYYRGKMALGLEDTQGIVDWLSMQELLRGEILSSDQVLERINAVTLEDVRRVAQRIFQSDRLNLAIIAPEGSTTETRLRNLLRFS